VRRVIRSLAVVGLAAVVSACRSPGSDGAGAERQGGSTTHRFVGSWSLESWEARTPFGEVTYPFGEDPAGRIMYDATGNMSVQLMRQDRPRFNSDDPFGGTVDEIQSAFEGFFAYYGRYSVQEGDSTVIHHLVGSSFPNWVGVDQVRHFAFSGDTLTLSTPPLLAEGATAVHTLVWIRER
jgi:hypothetical protein